MTRTYRDSTVSADIPQGTQVVKGYVDGIYRWSQADWDRHAGSALVRIAVHASTNDGAELDVEQGDATPDQAPGWARMRRSSGQDPTIYCNRSTWPQVIDAFNAQAEPQPHYDIADWTGQGHILAGSIGTQWANDTMIGQHFDIGWCADYWPGVDPAPGPSPSPQPPSQEDSDMALMLTVKSSGQVWLLSGNIYEYISNPQSESALKAAGVAEAQGIDDDLHTRLQQGSQALRGKITGTLNVSGALSAS